MEYAERETLTMNSDSSSSFKNEKETRNTEPAVTVVKYLAVKNRVVVKN